jgi:hypothetical protein
VASVISMRNGVMQEVEEEVDEVFIAMRDGGVFQWHAANGTHGWQPKGERGTVIVVRAEEIATAYPCPTLPNPMDRR